MKVMVEVLPEVEGEVVTATITDKDNNEHVIKSGTANNVYSGLLEKGDAIDVEAGETTRMELDPGQSSAHEVEVVKEEPAKTAAPKSGASTFESEEDDEPESKSKSSTSSAPKESAPKGKK